MPQVFAHRSVFLRDPNSLGRRADDCFLLLLQLPLPVEGKLKERLFQSRLRPLGVLNARQQKKAPQNVKLMDRRKRDRKRRGYALLPVADSPSVGEYSAFCLPRTWDQRPSGVSALLSLRTDARQLRRRFRRECEGVQFGSKARKGLPKAGVFSGVNLPICSSLPL